MFKSNLLFLTGLISLGSISCIVSKSNPKTVSEKGDNQNADNAVAQSIDRDYLAGYDDHYGHGGYGLSAHANYGFSEGHDGYAVIDSGKHHIHHSEDHHHHHHDHHKHYDYAHHKALAIKSLLVPLAGVALLGAAAAFVSNPILLQLGVISSSSLGRRKRDANSIKGTTTQEDRFRLNEIKLLERFVAQIPQREVENEEKKILASYLSCAGTSTKNLCLERLACELNSPEGTSMPMEANVLTIMIPGPEMIPSVCFSVLNEILDNKFVPEETKIQLSKAVDRGRENFGCAAYECQQLENPPRQFIATN